MTDDDFEKRYAELQAQYVARTGERLDRLERLVEELAASASPEELEPIHAIVHRLAGSGQTLGFPAISEESVAMEERLKEAIQAEAVGSELAGELEQYIEAIRDRLAAESAE